MKKSIHELFRGLDCTVIRGSVEVTGISIDSRQVTEGDLFFALEGDKTDGNRYIDDALKAGAAAVCCRESAPQWPDTALITVKDPRNSLGIVSDRFWESPSRRLKLVGITGTNGKTSTAFFMRHILGTAGATAGITGTVVNEAGGRTFAQNLTTPEAHEFNRLLHLMAEGGAEYAVSEVSSQGIDKGRIEGLYFSQAVFTNLTGEHLDYHGTMDEYFSVKRKLFDGLGNESTSVINLDDPYGEKLAADFPGAGGVSLSRDCFMKGTVRELSGDGSVLDIFCEGEKGTAAVSRPGLFNCMNYLCAAAGAVLLGTDFSTVIHAAATLPPVPGRIDEVPSGEGFRVYVDYAHTDNALAHVLAALKEFTEGRIITVFGAGGDRDRSKRPRMGKTACDVSDLVIVTSDNPRTEDPDGIIRDILEGTQGREFRAVTDRKEAIFLALNTAREGDSVLIAGKGHEDYQIIGTEKTHFSDAEIVAEFFNNRIEQI